MEHSPNRSMRPVGYGEMCARSSGPISRPSPSGWTKSLAPRSPPNRARRRLRSACRPRRSARSSLEGPDPARSSGAPPGRRGDAPPRSRTPRRALGRRPTWPGPAGAASRPESPHRPTRRSSSSSSAAGPTAARAPTAAPVAGAQPARTVPRSGPSGPRTSPANGQGLRFDLRPPHDLQSSHTDLAAAALIGVMINAMVTVTGPHGR